MKKIATPYLEDIYTSIVHIETYTTLEKMEESKFLESTLVQDAVTRRLEIIGEATKRLEADFKEQYDQIPWRKMTGLRDILIHEYDEVDLHQVWLVLVQDLPVLKTQINDLLKQGIK